MDIFCEKANFCGQILGKNGMETRSIPYAILFGYASSPNSQSATTISLCHKLDENGYTGLCAESAYCTNCLRFGTIAPASAQSVGLQTFP